MTAKQLQKKYPNQWKSIYDTMVFDMKQCLTQRQIQLFDEGCKGSIIKRIAHNAAFAGCYELHQTMKELTFKRLSGIILAIICIGGFLYMSINVYTLPIVGLALGLVAATYLLTHLILWLLK